MKISSEFARAFKVILVDDEDAIRKATKQWLSLAGIEVDDFSNAESALSSITQNENCVVVSDIRMPGMDGMAFAKEVHRVDPDIPVLLVTAHGDVRMAVEAMRNGVYDFIEKPVEPDLLVDRIERAGEKRRLVLENKNLQRLLSQKPTLESRMIGQSQVMTDLRQQVLMLGQTPVDTVINGATGTGKELIARCLHDFSIRSEGPFVAVNCGAIPENLFESELFGHERGSFTGADSQRIGKIEHAQGGTLFLDEIESMPMNFQIKLLRVLQERKLERVGSNKEIPLDLWVIAATKVDLVQASAEGVFREDLYYRFNVIELNLPDLKDRREDIPQLFEFFARKAAIQYERDYPELTEQDIARLMDHLWPGNVRQLKNVAERYVLGMGSSNSVGAILGHDEQDVAAPASYNLAERVQAFEKQLIIQSMQRQKGNILAVMDELELPRRTLNNKMKLYDIQRRDYK
ncbi:sigma-54 dependent transcriptional regulator [Vibrio hannami]|uniref:sigma-54-dependent transcriptional regulator n=1 Tax=Vibrio hannami TaxID=2717094 RepID=UPI00240EB56B|nr:sigma-54 dependent transcriptional regulator [Vibrio hannami]MDG3087745.1 sigma-54 dependent transcriptional regulator [Vibrio hannami]